MDALKPTSPDSLAATGAPSEPSRVHVVCAEPSIANHFLAELRDVTVQQDSLRFRRNLQRLGEIMAYRISSQLSYTDKTVHTPLGESSSKHLHDFPVLATVLRAGLPFHQGFLNYFDQSPSAFAAAYRIEGTAQVQVQVDYLSAPSLDERVLILADPMLASGKSLVQTYRAMLRFGTPRQVHIAAVIASPQGVEYVTREVPEANLWVAAIDDHLNAQAYIVPGLGDAGDLSYGSKL
ncbi:uracil phosphoribosyltransferase [Hymenobacter taeanensis]|uniref:Uracil phosphoribosyltransferase n=1 Tax=Hymenobacter taeanensis TaxID=2735321 RepID=A0A6M6BG07_9BACT|nr:MULTISPECIES: uracil phosphoribosyltransferase [Hymenobacter]QJX47216.1 uracil phosphoribosyltransferase [Hymenobacter taeanensis]UOQ81134.1 uracil phosphoribosyltransferase [Hymenobacter sp. 5414T-23]